MKEMIAALAILATGAILWGEHYTPWTRWIGRELKRTEAYILGLLAIIIPLVMLWVIWAVWPPQGNAYVWAIVTMLADVSVGGLVVLGLYQADRLHSAERRAKVAERERQALRDQDDETE